MVLLETLCLLAFLLIFIYKWSKAKYHVLKERGIAHEKPKPLLGNISLDVVRGKVSYLKSVCEWQEKFRDCKVYGVYSFRDPAIFINDLDLIKRVAIKDFDKFTNRKPINSSQNLFTNTLVALNDQKWREMRNTLTPAFTGSRMRFMFDLINECCKDSLNFLRDEVSGAQSGSLDVEMKDFSTRFTTDVIASAVFGIKVNSFKDPNNDFYVTGSSIIKLDGKKIFKAILMRMIPSVFKLLGIKIDNEEKIKYFKSLVKEALKYRRDHDIVRPDMINLLLEAQRNFEETKLKVKDPNQHAEFNDEDLLSQCLMFFVAGFETVSTCLAFTCHELAVNEDKQQLLYEEVKEVDSQLDGRPVTYDLLMKMKYMDMVISESLRKWPVVAANRLCSEDCQILDDHGKLLAEFKKNDVVYIPVYSLHRDPNYFPEPEKFIPERFNEEENSLKQQAAYMPFGLGPRSCIGNRFALMEVKALMYSLILNFKMKHSAKAPKELGEIIKGFRTQPKAYWVNFQNRGQD